MQRNSVRYHVSKPAISQANRAPLSSSRYPHNTERATGYSVQLIKGQPERNALDDTTQPPRCTRPIDKMPPHPPPPSVSGRCRAKTKASRPDPTHDGRKLPPPKVSRSFHHTPFLFIFSLFPKHLIAKYEG